MDGPLPFLIVAAILFIALRLGWTRLVWPRMLWWRHSKRHARWWNDGIAAFEARNYDAMKSKSFPAARLRSSFALR